MIELINSIDLYMYAYNILCMINFQCVNVLTLSPINFQADFHHLRKYIFCVNQYNLFTQYFIYPIQIFVVPSFFND